MSNLKELVEQFANTVMAQKEALRARDVEAGNRFADERTHIWERLRAEGNEGRAALAKLFNDDHPDVRASAAAHLLRYRSNEAKRRDAKWRK